VRLPTRGSGRAKARGQLGRSAARDARGAEVSAIVLQVRGHLLDLSAALLEGSQLLVAAVVPMLSSFDVPPRRCVVRPGGASMGLHEPWHPPLTLLLDQPELSHRSPARSRSERFVCVPHTLRPSGTRVRGGEGCRVRMGASPGSTLLAAASYYVSDRNGFENARLAEVSARCCKRRWVPLDRPRPMSRICRAPKGGAGGRHTPNGRRWGELHVEREPHGATPTPSRSSQRLGLMPMI